MARVVKVDGSHEELGFNPELEVLQKAVGGFIELVHIPADAFVALGGDGEPNMIQEEYVAMYVNEEGLLQKLAPNKVASAWADRPLVGDVVLLTEKDWKASISE